jgi:hypothetical protein
MMELINEIRINPRYVQHVRSEFPSSDLQEEATPLIRKNVSRTEDYLKKITTSLDVHQGILPPNCRFIEKVSKGTIVVIEEPPAYRTIQVAYPMSKELEILKNDHKIDEYGIDEDFYMNNENMPWKFTLAMPYVIHVLMFDRYDALMSGQVFLRNARLAGYSDYLLKAPFMNISSDGWICYGDKAGGKRGSLAASIEHTIMVFWSATFNADYTYNYSSYKNVAGVNTYIGWQALSKIDPMFIYNVEWLKEHDTLEEAIVRTRSHCDSRSKSEIRYEELTRVFSQPADTGVDEKIRRTSRSKRKARLYYDIAQGVYLDNRFFFHVGDPIKWGDKIAHVDSFIGFFESDQIRIVRLQLDNGKLINVRFNKKIKEYMLKTAKEMRFETEGTMKNGAVVKPDDIVVMNDGRAKIYRKVHFIRKSRDGVTEARLGTSFYILENTEGEVLDIASPKYRDLEINKDDKYIYINTNNGVPYYGGVEVQYDGINVSRMGTLRMEFRSTELSDLYHISMDNNTQEFDRYGRERNPIQLYNLKDCKPLPGIFRVGRKINCMRKAGGAVEDGAAWATPNGIVYNQYHETSQPKIDELVERCLINEGSTFKLESYDLDLEFNIGEKVVYSDWKNPVNMLIIRTITGFKIDTSTNSLYFILQDKEGRLSQVEYVKGSRPGTSSNRAGIVNIGRVRKITNKFGRVTAGTKIKAKKGYIPHFPKKDVNIIIGFITDTGGDDPLVLCSNCCTLWYSDMMENFSRITIKSKRWPTLAHAPIDITKIKPQPGDIVNGQRDYKINGGWLVVRTHEYKTMRMAALNNYTSYPDMYTLDKYTQNHVLLDCIPNPRMSPTEQGKMDTCRGFANFHGLFIENRSSTMEFLDDGRSLLHVQDSHK